MALCQSLALLTQDCLTCVPYAPHIDALIGQLPEELFGRFYATCRLYGQLRYYRDEVRSYEIGVNALHTALGATVQRCPRLFGKKRIGFCRTWKISINERRHRT